MVKLVDLNGEWAAAIGRCFVAFGSIEDSTVTCLQEIPKDRIQKSVKNFRLGQRIDLIIELLEAHPGYVYEQLTAKLSRAKKMSETRNLIAHNPLILGIHYTDDSYTVKESIVSLRNDQHRISLAELQEFATESEQLATDLHRCTAAVVNALRGGAPNA